MAYLRSQNPRLNIKFERGFLNLLKFTKPSLRHANFAAPHRFYRVKAHDTYKNAENGKTRRSRKQEKFDPVKLKRSQKRDASRSRREGKRPPREEKFKSQKAFKHKKDEKREK